MYLLCPFEDIMSLKKFAPNESICTTKRHKTLKEGPHFALLSKIAHGGN